jgi:hypothetical protein
MTMSPVAASLECQAAKSGCPISVQDSLAEIGGVQVASGAGGNLTAKELHHAAAYVKLGRSPGRGTGESVIREGQWGMRLGVNLSGGTAREPCAL